MDILEAYNNWGIFIDDNPWLAFVVLFGVCYAYGKIVEFKQYLKTNKLGIGKK